jgi:hypothetical protein
VIVSGHLNEVFATADIVAIDFQIQVAFKPIINWAMRC